MHAFEQQESHSPSAGKHLDRYLDAELAAATPPTELSRDRRQPVEARPYQIELVQKAQSQNSILVSKTKTGKTFMCARNAAD